MPSEFIPTNNLKGQKEGLLSLRIYERMFNYQMEFFNQVNPFIVQKISIFL